MAKWWHCITLAALWQIGVVQDCVAQEANTTRNGQAMEISSCVGGPPIALSAVDARALLDQEEREKLLAEMLARYPMLERDGFAPAAILLWHKAAGEWLYVSMKPNGFDDNALCFTATFVAKMFQITPALTSKYFLEEPGKI
jgi:hypothetical protein